VTKVYIYELLADGEAFYVGRTTNPLRRLTGHKNDHGSTKKAQFIQKCIADGKEITMAVIEEVEASDLSDLEFQWVESYQCDGHDLKNSKAGDSGKLSPKAAAALRKEIIAFKAKQKASKAIAKRVAGFAPCAGCTRGCTMFCRDGVDRANRLFDFGPKMKSHDTVVHFSTFKNSRDVVVSDHCKCEWPSLVKILMRPHRASNAKDGLVIAPWKFKDEPARRIRDDVELASVIFLDFDKGISLPEAKQKFAEFEHVGYTSYSHMKDGEDDHRFRIVLPLASPVTPEQLVARRNAIYDWAGPVDRSCLSISRAFYFPSCPPERKPQALSWHHESDKLFDLMSFPEEQPPIFTPSSTPTTNADKQWLIEKLSSIYVGEEPVWFKVASCMAGSGFTFDEFCTVTIGGLMKEKSVHDCEQKWRAVQGKTNQPAIGYLFNLLKQHGIVKQSTQKQIDALIHEKIMGRWK
jgi:hypothetical protein